MAVPIRDRRHRKRIVTLKNFRNVLLVAVAIFAVISIRSELRAPRTGDFGRILSREVAGNDVQVKQREVVIEAPPVNDAVSADPLSLQGAAREQFLQAEPPQPVTMTSAAATQTAELRRSQHTRIQIVGDSSGVEVVQADRAKPVLGGGFGRK